MSHTPCSSATLGTSGGRHQQVAELARAGMAVGFKATSFLALPLTQPAVVGQPPLPLDQLEPFLAQR
jgi:2-dehydro-3-deoxyphosphooctonate aldolase (KDO 8-P synthase)